MLDMNKRFELIVKAVGAVFLFTIPIYIGSLYFITIANFVFIYSILAVGLRLIMKVGEVSFGHAAFMGVGAYASALLTMKLHLSFWLAWPIACGITAFLAFLLGSLAVRTKGVQFFTVSLAMGETIRLITLNWNPQLLGGAQGIYGIPPPTAITVGPLAIEFISKTAMYYIALIGLIVTLLVAMRIDRSLVGRIWDAIGQDDRLAAVIGINVYRQKVVSFILASTVAGLAGVVFAHMMTYISPYDFSFFFGMQLIIYIMFGGAATLAGPVAGVAILVVLTELLRKVGHYEMIFSGFILLLVLRFMPEGIVNFGMANFVAPLISWHRHRRRGS